jgi:hypothetical protein
VQVWGYATDADAAADRPTLLASTPTPRKSGTVAIADLAPLRSTSVAVSQVLRRNGDGPEPEPPPGPAIANGVINVGLAPNAAIAVSGGYVWIPSDKPVTVVPPVDPAAAAEPETPEPVTIPYVLRKVRARDLVELPIPQDWKQNVGAPGALWLGEDGALAGHFTLTTPATVMVGGNLLQAMHSTDRTTANPGVFGINVQPPCNFFGRAVDRSGALWSTCSIGEQTADCADASACPTKAVLKSSLADDALLASVDLGVDAVTTGVAVDDQFVWVANLGRSEVAKIRPADGAVLGRYPVGLWPMALISDGQSVWVVNHLEETVSQLRVGDGTLVGTFDVGGQPRGIALSPDSVWVTNERDGTVTRLRRDTGALISTTPVGAAPRSIVWDGTSIFVGNGGDGTVRKITP